MTSPFSLEGKRACVTGASKGIGLGIAKAMAAAGADLTLVARGAVDLERARLEVSALGVRVDTLAFDLSRTADLESWYAEAVCAAGAPDILVNNAGVAMRAPIVEYSVEDWDTIMALNLSSAFALSKAFAVERFASGKSGAIVNISSIQAVITRAGTAAYCATKGGLTNLTKGLGVEWAKSGIRVNAVAPGFIATPMTEGLRESAEFDAWIQQRCPMGRWGEPEEIGSSVVFLASDAARFITGQTLYVDGGTSVAM